MLLICRCKEYGLVPQAAVEAVEAKYRSEGNEVVFCDDLCRDAARGGDLIRSCGEGCVVAACHPRAVRALFARVGAVSPAGVENLRSEKSKIPAQARKSAGADGWLAWYPVIDTQRCVNCKKCVDFCVFGVYESAPKFPLVAKPENCKTDCPACARMCPQQAIIFPKCDESPICGAEISEVAGEGKLSPTDKLTLLRNRSKVKLFPS